MGSGASFFGPKAPSTTITLLLLTAALPPPVSALFFAYFLNFMNYFHALDQVAKIAEKWKKSCSSMESFCKSEINLRQSSNKIDDIMKHAHEAKAIAEPTLRNLLAECGLDQTAVLLCLAVPFKERVVHKAKKFKSQFSKMIDLVSFVITIPNSKQPKHLAEVVRKIQSSFNVCQLVNGISDDKGDEKGYRNIIINAEVKLGKGDFEDLLHVIRIEVHLADFCIFKDVMYEQSDFILFQTTAHNKSLSKLNTYCSLEDKRILMKKVFDFYKPFIKGKIEQSDCIFILATIAASENKEALLAVAELFRPFPEAFDLREVFCIKYVTAGGRRDSL